ncbi:MAG TPA: TIGR01777 family oxidoreductase [Fimbriimonas sp.]|nr:TIGR01777 family oxidoreductase [Fimbriimonas sp.]
MAGRIVIAGASGFIGSALIGHFSDCEVVALNRKPDSQPGARVATWDGPWQQEVNGAEAVINLAGAPITLKWNERNRKKILDSRVETTRKIGEAVRQSKDPPRVWVNGSAVGYYGDRAEWILTEASPAGSGFLADVCKAWEAAAEAVETPRTRRVLMRTGVVLGRGGGSFEVFRRLMQAHIGAAGDGGEWMPWIHLDDLCRMIRWCIQSDVISGAINGSSRWPCRHSELMVALCGAMGASWYYPVPRFAVLGMGKLFGPDPELLLSSQRAVPQKALDHGFEWSFPRLYDALEDLLS